MSREIKFRGKRLDSGEWVYGNVILSKDAEDDYSSIIVPQTNADIFTDGSYLGIESWFRVDLETIGQYTGLTDKNGTKIFEGDIMVFRTGTVGVVVHSRQGFVWQGYPQDPLNPVGYFSGKWQDDFEVIGDIHNNAELLEVE